MKSTLRNSLYLLSFTPAIAVIIGNLSGGAFTLLNTAYTLGILAIFEWITPAFLSNHNSSKQDAWPKLILYAHVPLQILSISSLFYGIYYETINGVWIVAAAFSTGLNSGTSAIVVAHEFIHCRKPFDRFLGKFLLFTAGNIYFYIEHLAVHHRWVGTAKDNATAKFGESLYAFFIRSACGQIKGAYQIETERVKALGIAPIFLYHYVVRQICVQGLVIILSVYFLGSAVLLALIIQGLLANFLLEYVNYIQHYGLTRDEKQRASELHSWESNQFASRFLLVDLSRHADHHNYASKPYHTLINYTESPKLPSGYAGLFFVAAIPFLWRKIIHKQLADFNAKHIK